MELSQNTEKTNSCIQLLDRKIITTIKKIPVWKFSWHFPDCLFSSQDWEPSPHNHCREGSAELEILEFIKISVNFTITARFMKNNPIFRTIRVTLIKPHGWYNVSLYLSAITFNHQICVLTHKLSTMKTLTHGGVFFGSILA